MNELIKIILSDDDQLRDRSLDSVCREATTDELLQHAEALDQFRRDEDNLYHRVRALFFLSAIYRYHLPGSLPAAHSGLIPFAGYEHLLSRRFTEAIESFLETQRRDGPSDAIASALAQAYHQLGFQTLADQVRRSVRTVRGNQWMFRLGHPEDHPLRIRKDLFVADQASGAMPILRETTAVRMDFSHSAWSDIFFLGMDFPEGARVLNVSVDLAVRGRDTEPKPPIETYLRVIDQPVIRLASVDLGASVEVESIAEMFDFARDYLGLLKAARDRRRHCAARSGRGRAVDSRVVGSVGWTRQGIGVGQQDQRHPERIAIGRVNQFARIVDFDIDAGNRSD